MKLKNNEAPTGNKKRRISIRFSERMYEKIADSVERNEYGSRGRSLWISEAIEDLDDLLSRLFVHSDDEMKNAAIYEIHCSWPSTEKGKVIPIFLEPKIVNMINKWITVMEEFEKDPTNDFPQKPNYDMTRIVHMAAMDRLLKEGNT